MAGAFVKGRLIWLTEPAATTAMASPATEPSSVSRRAGRNFGFARACSFMMFSSIREDMPKDALKAWAKGCAMGCALAPPLAETWRGRITTA
jgi:hypothetical protein